MDAYQPKSCVYKQVIANAKFKKMKYQKKHTLLAFLLSLFSLIVYSQSIPVIDSLVNETMQKKQIPGLSVAVIKNGEVIHRSAYGYSVVEHNVESKIETVYQIASITKQFIAAGVLLLEEDGKLDLHEPISTYLDSLPAKWRNLTLHRLLTHTAGLAPMAHELKSLKNKAWPKYMTRDMLWNSAVQDSIYAPLGTKFDYHNFGYSLAVFIIEKVTETDHREFFKNRIFEPLEMYNTFF